MREYERISTTCANAYVQPLMSRHLRNLEKVLAEAGYRCPLFLMLSGAWLVFEFAWEALVPLRPKPSQGERQISKEL